MAEQEQQIAAVDAPVLGSTQTARAVDLARLLHYECSRLLQIYEKESSLTDHAPDGGRIVSLSHESEEPSTEQQVQLLHSALRQCLGLIHCVIQKEEEEWGELEGDYETLKKNVKLRLEHLLHSTKSLVETENRTLEVTPDHQCNEETDGAGGVFGLKMWTYRVLQELVHWADHAAQTLTVLHTEREATEEM
ncbi:ciliary neurotrophic factor-like isoform X2 [Centropristis striata]|uniref:ciliary neurotrophic factor-like isoform X2 n=1 Tax=Centropristis striata TaxID=184440 RepID=UPI0027E01D34|nr:ciliary neurotrophic factor-like isoform X2 [Centropristis striata]